MRKGWSETTVGEIAELVSRGRAPSYCEDDGIAVINQKCIRNGRIYFEFARLTDSKKKSIPDWAFLRVGDTLINSTGVGTLGRASFVSRLDVATTFDSHVTLVRPSPNLCYPPFIGLFLNFREREIEMFGGGSTGQTELSREAVNAFPITVPPLVEQKRIVDVVSSVDAYIDALQQQADTARAARNAVLHELLSEGGDDWTETTLGEIITLEYGKPLKAENRDGNGFPVFGSAGEVGLHSEPLVNEAPVIIVGRKGTAGAVWWSELPCSVIDTAYYVVQKDETDMRFLYFALGFLDLPSMNAQTGVPGLNRDRAYSSRIVLPQLNEQKRIVEIMSSMDEVIQSTEQAVVGAKALRSGLLSDLLSGNHEIPASYDSLLGAA
jgi:type I restriction enzyme S subunit